MLKPALEQVRAEHPELFDDKGNFTGSAMTGNGAGGDRRVKNAVRVPCAKSDSAAGKSMLATTRDSVSTMHKGGQGRGERGEHGRKVHLREGDDGVKEKPDDGRRDAGTQPKKSPWSRSTDQEGATLARQAGDDNEPSHTTRRTLPKGFKLCQLEYILSGIWFSRRPPTE